MTQIIFPAIDMWAIAPLVAMAVTGLVLLVLDILPPSDRKDHLALIGLAGVLVSLVLTLQLWGSDVRAFRGMVVLDSYALFFNLIIGYSTGLVLLFSIDYVRRQSIETGEFYILVIFAAAGMMLMASAGDLIIVFLGLETMSISLYVLAGFFRWRLAAGESSMKYFLLGAFASSFFLYGIALLYGATGTTNLGRVGAALAAPGAARDPLNLAGLALLLVGFGFKTSSVPFHQWAPDVYEGAPTAVAALIATGSKAAAFAALLRVLVAMRALQADWLFLLWLLAVLTMTVGNVVALVQGNLKRMLAYSSVAHVGYMLVGIVAGLAPGGPAVLYYLVVYSFATVGAFGVILLLERDGRMEEAVDLAAYGGLGARHPILALVLTVFMLSLIGLPPTAGFVGKFYLFSAAMRSGFVWLAVIAVLNSVVAAYYYLRLIVFMYMRDPEGPEVTAALTPAAGLALAVAVWATLQLGLWPGPAFALAQRAIAPLLP